MILDTNAVSALNEGDPSIVGALSSARRHSVPVVVLGEFRAAILGSRIASQMQVWLDRFEREFEILDVTSDTSRHYADIRHHLKKMGRPIPVNDVWIAALAREHHLAILTRDRHFENVPNITCVGW